MGSSVGQFQTSICLRFFKVKTDIKDSLLVTEKWKKVGPKFYYVYLDWALTFSYIFFRSFRVSSTEYHLYFVLTVMRIDEHFHLYFLVWTSSNNFSIKYIKSVLVTPIISMQMTLLMNFEKVLLPLLCAVSYFNACVAPKPNIRV